MADPRHGPKVRFLLRIGASSNSSSLDLDAMDVAHQKRLAQKKHFVVVAALVVAMSETHKSIEVELPLEGSNLT